MTRAYKVWKGFKEFYVLMGGAIYEIFIEEFDWEAVGCMLAFLLALFLIASGIMLLSGV